MSYIQQDFKLKMLSFFYFIDCLFFKNIKQDFLFILMHNFTNFD